jgi:starch phosphorylase
MSSADGSRFTPDHLKRDRESLRKLLLDHLVFSLGKTTAAATPRDWLHAAAFAVRDHMVERWMETTTRYLRTGAKRVYYLSLEFLTGRMLSNNLHNIGLYDSCRDALSDLDLAFEEIAELEPDAALGNGGLGRLAACLLDSMATLSIPGYGYGIRYEYGLFFQRIVRGSQVEQPDNWLRYGNPWEFPRPEVLYPVRFGGHVMQYSDERGRQRFQWADTELVMAMAFDMPVPGFGSGAVNNMRLWSAKASREFNLQDFNEGLYIKAVERKTESENLSKVLYPADTTRYGRELRLKQQYFFVSASLQDILRRYLAARHPLDELPDRVAIQLNDTHPSLAVPELMRLLVDLHHLGWDRAWDLTRRTFGYTNHTLMPEALETWPVSLFEQLLPRHLQLVYEINRRLLDDVRRKFPGDVDLVRRVSLIDEAGERRVRMAHLACAGSHRVNGVSKIHTDLMKATIFSDFERLSPGTIVNVTNGVTPRRWLNGANPGLALLLNDRIGQGWISDLSQLARVKPLADDPGFRTVFQEIKLANKLRLVAAFRTRLSLTVDPSAMFDVQVKRIHEYKRQLLNLLHVITRYNRIRAGHGDALVPRVVIFSGKAAPGYAAAKLIIELIHRVAHVVNHDPAVGNRLKVAFVANYNVSNAELIIPAADLSEQISTAGTEASGTGNMKLALNGALTIGTLDGANIEMRDEVGADNMFIFGMTAAEVAARRQAGYNPADIYDSNLGLRQAMDMIATGFFTPEAPRRFLPIFERLTTFGDYFMLLADYADYVECQARVDTLFQQPDEWARRAILNVAGMGNFSSDRTVRDYAREVWNLEPGTRTLNPEPRT